MTGSFVLGSAKFSPDGSQVAFGLARGDPQNEMGWVAVSDGLSGPSRVILESPAGGYFSVVSWLNSSTLLLQWAGVSCGEDCPAGLWTVGTDGQGLTQVADGTFLTLTNAGQP